MRSGLCRSETWFWGRGVSGVDLAGVGRVGDEVKCKRREGLRGPEVQEALLAMGRSRSYSESGGSLWRVLRERLTWSDLKLLVWNTACGEASVSAGSPCGWWDYGGSRGAGVKWRCWCILKAEPPGFADGLGVECERKKDRDFGPSSGRNGVFHPLRLGKWEKSSFEAGFEAELGLGQIKFGKLNCVPVGVARRQVNFRACSSERFLPREVDPKPRLPHFLLSTVCCHAFFLWLGYFLGHRLLRAIFKVHLEFLRWLSRLMLWSCHCWGSSHFRGVGSIPRPGTSSCLECNQIK